MSAIPDRWIPYKACGNVIEGTRFICFKVPLKKSVQTRIQDIKEIWDIPALLNKIPNLGAVIDLTNTTRYYNPAEFQAAGVLYRKILMPGRIIPAENKVTEFMNAIDEFLGKDGESLIGIHCTHGLNRTGYMVCRYMRDRLGVPAKDAIKRFEKARGYQIERNNFIADLLGKSPFTPEVTEDPVANEYETEEQREKDRRNRHNQRCRCSTKCNKYKISSNNKYNHSCYSRSSGNDSRSYNWRDREGNQSNWRSEKDSDRNERSRVCHDRSKSNSESSDSSYDFRYDY